MRIRNEMFIKILIAFLLFFFIYAAGYVCSYLRFDDKEFVSYEALRLQNESLKTEIEEIHPLQKIEGEYILGKVIVRDLYHFFDEVMINVGSEDGVQEGDAVLNDEGLVGVVYQVLEQQSYVKLLTSDYNVSVKIRDFYGNLNQGRVTLLDKYSELKEGDLVYTSGYSSIQEGIYIGKVEKVFLDKDNLGKELSLQLVDNTHLNYVAIVRNSK